MVLHISAAVNTKRTGGACSSRPLRPFTDGVSAKEVDVLPNPGLCGTFDQALADHDILDGVSD